MESRERVLAVAKEMFLAHGIRSARMDDIAHQCGISKRTLYELFADREALIEETLKRVAADNYAGSMAVASGAENVLHAFWLIFTSNNGVYRGNATILDELKRYYPKVLESLMMEVHEQIVRHTRERLLEGVEDGLIMSSLDLEFYSRAMTNYVFGLGIIEANTSITGVVLTERTVPSAVLIFLRGISTEKGREYIDENLLSNIER